MGPTSGMFVAGPCEAASSGAVAVDRVLVRRDRVRIPADPDVDVSRHMDEMPGARPIHDSIPHFVALPTTAGTGSEVTKVAVITDTAQQEKLGLGGPLMTARAALVDPDGFLVVCGDDAGAVSASAGASARKWAPLTVTRSAAAVAAPTSSAAAPSPPPRRPA